MPVGIETQILVWTHWRKRAYPLKRAIAAMTLAFVLVSTIFVPAGAAASWTGKDALGKQAPDIENVKWLLAPTMDGTITTAYRYKDRLSYSTGLYFFHGTKDGIIDRYGNVVLPAKYGTVDTDGKVIAASLTRDTRNADTALFTMTGKQITKHIYSQYVSDSYFKDKNGEFCQVFAGGQKCYVNLKTGKELPRVREIGYFDETGLAGFTDSNNKAGYMDTAGKLYYAPTSLNMDYVGPSNGVLFCTFKDASGKKGEGVYTADYKPIVVNTDPNKDIYCSPETKLISLSVSTAKNADDFKVTLYDYSGNVLKDGIGDGSSIQDYLDENGHRIVDYWDIQNGVRRELLWDIDADTTALGENDGFPEGYYEDGQLQSGYFEAVRGVKSGRNQWIVPPHFSSIDTFTGKNDTCIIAASFTGNVLRNSSSVWKLYSLEGKVLASGTNQCLDPTITYRVDGDELSNGYLLCRRLESDGRYGDEGALYNEDGKQLTPFGYDFEVWNNCVSMGNWKDWENGSSVGTAYNCSVYDLDGKLITANNPYRPEGRCRASKAEGLSAVLATDGSGLYGYCDENFKLVIPCVFSRVDEFVDGQAWVQYQGKWGVINNPNNKTADAVWMKHLCK